MAEGGVELVAYAQPTNGLVYQTSVAKLEDLDILEDLARYQICATELGCGDQDYVATPVLTLCYDWRCAYKLIHC